MFNILRKLFLDWKRVQIVKVTLCQISNSFRTNDIWIIDRLVASKHQNSGTIKAAFKAYLSIDSQYSY